MTKAESLAYMRQRFPLYKLMDQMREDAEVVHPKEEVKKLDSFGEFQEEQHPNAILSDEK